MQYTFGVVEQPVVVTLAINLAASMEIFLDPEPNTPRPEEANQFIESGEQNRSPLAQTDDAQPREISQPAILAEPVTADLADTSLAYPKKQSEEMLAGNLGNDFHSLDPRNIQTERIAGLIFAGIVSIGLLVGVIVVWVNIGANLIWILIASAAALLAVAFFAWVWFWPTISHRHSKWRLDEEGLEIRHGVLWRHQITIPLGRVQHADVSQGPLQRMYGLGTMTVNTAGTQNASVDLAGLAHENAIALRDQIVRQRKDQHVV